MNTQENHTSKKPAHLHTTSTTIALDGISTQKHHQKHKPENNHIMYCFGCVSTPNTTTHTNQKNNHIMYCFECASTPNTTKHTEPEKQSYYVLF